jgi:tetratricopeptide (TPR) repeat protein
VNRVTPMAKLFGGRSDPAPSQRLEEELESLERQARTASSGYETQFLNRAGNLCVEAGQPMRALGFYGRAIDAYLESGRFSAAEVLCKKLLGIAPDAVRARCTLAWLAIGKGYKSSVNQELADYVRAARKAGKEDLAAKQLRMMAEAPLNANLRELIGEHLLDLGEFPDADQVFRLVHQERAGLRSPPSADEGKLWAKLLRAALMGPNELKEQGRAPGDEDHQGLPALRDRE